ncbi:MAG: hypothetical protein R6W31_14850 [Bacteroidales bacterium]
MKKTIGLLGFLLLIIGAVFMDTPIIWIFTFPFYVIGFILILIFYLKQIDKSKKKTSRFIIISGVVMLWLLLGYASSDYGTYEALLLNNPGLQWNWTKIFIILAINLLASILIFIGVRKRTDFKLSQVILMTLPTVLLIPLTLILIKLYITSDFWLGSIGAS